MTDYTKATKIVIDVTKMTTKEFNILVLKLMEMGVEFEAIN